MEINILIKDCLVLNPQFEIEKNQSIAIKGNKIVEVGDSEELNQKFDAEEVIDGDSKLAIPGFIDGHTHTSQQLLKGRVADELPPVWQRILVPYENNLTSDDAYVSAKFSCLEMIKSGITTFADAGGPRMREVVEAAKESGLRAKIARSVMDQGKFIPEEMKDSPKDAIRKTEKLYKDFDGAGKGRINIWFGMRQVMSCTSDLIKRTAEAAEKYNTGIHIHLGEHRDEVGYTLENHKKRVAEYLHSLDLLGPNVIAAHSVMLSEKEIDLLSEMGVNAVHCPRANLTNHWFPKTPRLLNQGVNVGLGTDGTAFGNLDLFAEMRALRTGIIAYYGVPIFDPKVLTTKDLLVMAFEGGSKSVGMSDRLGILKKDYLADINLINLKKPHIKPTHNLINSLVDNVNANDITEVIANGKILMKNREVQTLDEEKIMKKAENHIKKIKEQADI